MKIHATARASTTTTTDDLLADGRTGSDRWRACLLAGATVLGPLLLVAGTLLEIDTGEGDVSGQERIGHVSQDPDRFSLGLVLLGAAGLTVMVLVRRRGGALATVGGVLAMGAGTASATGISMYGAVLTVMAGSGHDPEAMGALQDDLRRVRRGRSPRQPAAGRAELTADRPARSG